MESAAVMTRDVVVVSPLVSVGGAASLMARRKIRHLPVVQDGRVVGILSDRDLLKHTPDATCGEAMTTDPLTCLPDTSVSHVARLMLDHRIDCVPIVNSSGTLTGMVTSTDLLWLLVEPDQLRRLPFDFQLHLTESDAEAYAAAS